MTLEQRIVALVQSIGGDIKVLFSRALPSGGTSGQVLAKNSATAYDASWVTVSTSGSTPARRQDFVSPYSYVGVAVTGSADTATVWKITRIQINSDGTTTKLSASGVAWSNRTTTTYS